MTTTTLPACNPAAGRAESGRPRWERPGLALLLVGTALLYLWNLGASGWANSFYAAAVQAGTQDWTAWLFGSLDSGNAITVDKPPAALWVMGLSGRLFGFNSWSLLVPQALEGVAAVALLRATVRRTSGPAAGLLAGAACALTPVVALMFRFDNPDALLVLLMVAGAYCTVRASETANPRWLALAGTALGFGFLTKLLQAFLVLPAFALVYLVTAPTSPWRRVRHVLLAGLAVVVSAGWYVAVVALWPAGSRPYIGGSTNDSLLQLAFGYNGLGRIFGGEGNGGPGGGGGPGGRPGGGNAMFGGDTGIGRLFGDSMGTEISWLLPTALLGLVATLWLTRRRPRTDRTRAALLLWGGWLVVTGLVFSFMSGTIHPYYTVALAPAIATLAAIPARELWKRRREPFARLALAAMVAVTGAWDFALLARAPSWLPPLRWCVLVPAVLAAAALAVGVHRFRRGAVVVVIVALVAGGAASTAYALDTAAKQHGGSIPTSGPGGRRGAPGGGAPPRVARPGTRPPEGAPPRTMPRDAASGAVPDGARQRGEAPRARPGPVLATANDELTDLIERTDTRWAAATVGSQQAASLELATGKAVMAIGGFTGSDPYPTLAQFKRYVAGGEIRYLIAGRGFGGPGGGRGNGGTVTQWVKATFPATTVGGQTVYDLGGQS